MLDIEKRINRFQRLSRAESDSVRRLGVPVLSGEPGQRLLAAGEKAGNTILLLGGWAMLFRELPDARRQIMHFCLPGDLVDPCSLLLRRRDFVVEAITPVAYSRVSLASLTELVDRHPRLALPLLWGEARDVYWLRSHLLSIGRMTARERLAGLFLEFAERLASLDRYRDAVIEVPANQQMLADATGLSAVHVSRTLGAMEKDGLLSRRGHHLIVIDPGLLQGEIPDRFRPSVPDKS